MLLHLLGWGLVLLADPSSTATVGLGIAATAYLLGTRHAFDADHIAAIDNVTRRFIASGRPTVTVGFWFALGHSTVVILLCVFVIVGLSRVFGPFMTEGTWQNDLTGVIGAGVSGTFLVIVAAINAVGLVRLLRTAPAPAQPEDAVPQGLLTRILRRPLRGVTRPAHMYPVGFLFGLGFDTATEIGLLVVAASSVAAGLPWHAVIALPILFTAGMALFDTLDGAFMNVAYGWALSDPKRKRGYSITITALSVAVAATIGLIQLANAVSTGAHWSGGFWDAAASVDLGVAGVPLVIGLAAIFVAALILHRVRAARVR